MRIKEYLISRLTKLVGFGNIADYVYAFLSIGYPSGESVPKVLVDFNVLNIIRGLFTRFVVSTNLDWIWPYWMVRQFYATNNDFASRGFNPASINTTNRNWTGIGDLSGEFESTVDPRGLLTPYNNSWSLDCWVQLDEAVLTPAKLPKLEQKLINNLPIVQTNYTYKNKLAVSQTAFTREINSNYSTAFEKVTIKNISKNHIHSYFAFAFRPYNTEGISLINSICVNSNGEVLINNQLAAILMQIPYGITTSSLSKGDVHHFFDEAKNSKTYDYRASRVGMASCITIYKLDLAPGASQSFEIRMPNNPKAIKKLGHNEKKIDAYAQQLRQEKFETILDKQLKRWQEKLTEGMSIQVPDERLQNCFEANKAYLLMFYDDTYITPGPSTYHEFWFRDATYLLNGLDKLGYHQESRNILDTYKKRIYASGFFYSQAGEWDSNGQAIWTLMEHYRLTRDKEFLKENYNIIYRGARWISWKAQTNLKGDPGYKGLMPPGLSAEHFGLNDYYYWDDFWSLTGLREAALASKILNKNPRNFERDYQRLSGNIDQSLQFVEARLGKPIMPISPSRRMDSAAVGCLASYYPCRIYRPEDIRLINTIEELRDICFIGEGFFHDVNHSGYGTYLTMHFIQCYIGQRSTKAFPILQWVLDAASSTWCWPEAIHPRTMGGTIGDGHHGWAAADFVIVARNMLLLEEGNALVITPLIPKEWLKDGNVISVTNAPTYFGKISYTITVTKKTVTLKLQTKYHHQPDHISWELPVAIKKATSQGKTTTNDGTLVVLPAKAKEVTVTLA